MTDVHKQALSQELRNRLRKIIDDKRMPDTEFYDRAMDIVANIEIRLRMIKELGNGIEEWKK